MRSPPLPRVRKASRRARSARPSQTLLTGLTAVLVVAFGGACGTGARGPSTAPEEIPRLPNLTAGERPYLVDPLSGYPLVIPVEVEEGLRAGYQALVTTGDAAAARAAAAERLALDPGLHPAQVLWAQADYAEGLERESLERVRPVAAELPEYVAAQLLRGRAEERVGDVVEAYRAFISVAADDPLAADRASELRPEALDGLVRRVREALRRQRLDDAEEALAQLREWAPDAAPTLEAAAAAAAAREDDEAELAALRGLSELRPDDRALQERRADLELAVGEPGRGLEIIESLVAAHPEDGSLSEKLAYAKFRWRLTLLPEPVQTLAERAELERGDFAVLLYWLVPSVRYGKPDRPRIAADILDDPRREEIARVINLGLMEVDETLHRFSALEPVSRKTVLASQLEVLASTEPPLACARDLPPQPSTEMVCTSALRCGLLPRVEDCLPGAPVSGREALGLLRRTLELTSAR